MQKNSTWSVRITFTWPWSVWVVQHVAVEVVQIGQRRHVLRHLRERRAPVAAEGLDPDALLAAVAPAPLGTRLLRRFAELL